MEFRYPIQRGKITIIFTSINAEGTFIFDTDGCDNGVGGVLSQMQNGEEKVIAYASKTLKKMLRENIVLFTRNFWLFFPCKTF